MSSRVDKAVPNENASFQQTVEKVQVADPICPRSVYNRVPSAHSTALLGVTTPQPWRSTSIAGRRSAVSIRIFLTFCGVRRGFASSMHAIIEATIGDENDVPSTYL